MADCTLWGRACSTPELFYQRLNQQRESSKACSAVVSPRASRAASEAATCIACTPLPVAIGLNSWPAGSARAHSRVLAIHAQPQATRSNERLPSCSTKRSWARRVANQGGLPLTSKIV